MRKTCITFCILLTLSSLVSNCTYAQEIEFYGNTDPEIGNVRWRRDFDQGLKDSAKSQKPLFVLFQEVPGCHGCKKFGQSVLTEPLLVEAIEDEFTPILVLNNREGKDAEILKRYKEPTWNFQVIRFLDSSGKDIIERKDNIWTKELVLKRMISSLQKAERPIPSYLKNLIQIQSAQLKEATFAMHCFWTGEQQFGQLDGVIETEAGLLEGNEVTKVVYDPEIVSLTKLIHFASEKNLANKIYVSNRDKTILKKNLISKLQIFDKTKYKKAAESDQKKQIQQSHFRKLQLSKYQLTKVNAFAPIDFKKALSYLSPRQKEKFIALQGRK